jgi:hypothetical protein
MYHWATLAGSWPAPIDTDKFATIDSRATRIAWDHCRIDRNVCFPATTTLDLGLPH